MSPTPIERTVDELLSRIDELKSENALQDAAYEDVCRELAEAKLNAKGEYGMRLEANARAEALLQALIEVGFEREEGEQMSCRGCGMDMAHVYDADKHGTIYEGDKPGRPCVVGKAMAVAGFRALSAAVAKRARSQ